MRARKLPDLLSGTRGCHRDCARPAWSNGLRIIAVSRRVMAQTHGLNSHGQFVAPPSITRCPGKLSRPAEGQFLTDGGAIGEGAVSSGNSACSACPLSL